MSHFFLSYAHSAPLAVGDRLDTDTDRWVRQCFEDLSLEVAELLGEEPGDVGFADYLAEPGADWRTVLAEQLGTARVFVPLYSPGFFNRSWPMRERAAYLRRLENAFPGQPEKARAHLVPVLWIPLPDRERIPERRSALALGAGIQAYEENGLRALCKLGGFRAEYRRIIVRLAQRIAEITTHTDLPPGHAVPIDEVPVLESAAGETPFVIGLIGAPEPEPGWRPFGASQDTPIADYVSIVAERLGLPTKVIAGWRELKAVDTSPAVLVVDPWIVARAGGDDPFGELTGHLHPWVTPILVTDRRAARYSRSGADVVARASDRLAALGAYRVHEALDVEQVAHLIPSAVSEARRQFLRYGPVFPPPGSRRPRLTGDDVTPAEASEKSDDG